MRLCFILASMLAIPGMCANYKSGRGVVRVDPVTGRLVRVAPAVRPPAAKPAGPEMLEIVEQTARDHDVDPLLVQSVIEVESNYNQYAVSPKGAQGLMQLVPATARRFGVANSFDARENIEGGVKYLKYLTSLYPGDLQLALAAYNAGEGAVAKYGHSIPPYRETEDYVRKVASRYKKARSKAEGKAQQTAVKQPESASNYRPVRYYVDEQGRLYLSTAEPEQVSTTP